MELALRASLVSIVMAVLTGHLAALQDPIAAAVDALYPDELLGQTVPPDRVSCYGIYSTDGTANPTIVAAGYSGTGRRAVQILRRDSAGRYSVVAVSPNEIDLGGVECSISFPDIDLDARPEMLFESRGVSGPTAGWLFRWTGVDLENLTPTSTHEGRMVTDLYLPEFVDIYHDGTMQIVTGTGEQDDALHLFRLRGDVYVDDGTALTAFKWSPSSDWRTQALGVSLGARLPDSRPPYLVHVINGDRLGQHRVTSGTIAVNGVPVVTPAQLGAATEFAEASFMSLLPEDNQVTLDLTGPPGSYVTVVIRDSADPRSP